MGSSAIRVESELVLFLKQLTLEGRGVVSNKPLSGSTDDALPLLQQMDALARDELALALPAFSSGAALWAAQLFYHLCQFTVCRDIGEGRINAVCRTPCPEPRAPHTDWSADLVFRHLPKLFQGARHLSNADPLVMRMQEIAMEWPLSSVGIAGVAPGPLQLDSFAGDPALRRLYADRILAANDVSRLGDARIDALLRSDLGVHHGLAPLIAARLYPSK
jgi:hypothetical protein